VNQERDQVIAHYTNYTMQDYKIGSASVQLNFRGRCYQNVEGDACIAVPVTWDSTDRNNARAKTTGIDHLTGVYRPADKRWWLCSSRYEVFGPLGHLLYSTR
jgi:hypothetical protein